MSDQVLKKGTLECPQCKVKLEFECFGTLRLFDHDPNEGNVYKARCNDCGLYFKVKR